MFTAYTPTIWENTTILHPIPTKMAETIIDSIHRIKTLKGRNNYTIPVMDGCNLVIKY